MEALAPVTVRLDAPGIAVGVVVAKGCGNGESPRELQQEVRRATDAAVAARESAESAARKAEVRAMLRHGVYKPTGRGKPASEYLLNAAVEGQFPFIGSLVDINNLVSVETLLPISLVDVAKAGARQYVVRFGRAGEDYVFNRSGQVLSLADLLLLAREPGDLPCATPIKDSQATKTDETTTDVLAIVWAPASLAAVARDAARRMADLIRAHCGAQEAQAGELP
jgi:DNA/RNA-binding domain of Phe-tRNA-synthetase-like protein